jgi:hypothetical protein
MWPRGGRAFNGSGDAGDPRSHNRAQRSASAWNRKERDAWWTGSGKGRDGGSASRDAPGHTAAPAEYPAHAAQNPPTQTQHTQRCDSARRMYCFAQVRRQWHAQILSCIIITGAGKGGAWRPGCPVRPARRQGGGGARTPWWGGKCGGERRPVPSGPAGGIPPRVRLMGTQEWSRQPKEAGGAFFVSVPGGDADGGRTIVDSMVLSLGGVFAFPVLGRYGGKAYDLGFPRCAAPAQTLPTHPPTHPRNGLRWGLLLPPQLRRGHSMHAGDPTPRAAGVVMRAPPPPTPPPPSPPSPPLPCAQRCRPPDRLHVDWWAGGGADAGPRRGGASP